MKSFTLPSLICGLVCVVSSASLSAQQPSTIKIDAAPAATSTAVTTPGGTNGLVPVFTGASTIANSLLYYNAGGLGVGRFPAAPLDVLGKSIFRGAQVLSRSGDATSTAGFPAFPLIMQSSVYNSNNKGALLPYFQLQTEPAGNNTATTGATFNFLYYSGVGSTVSETGLYFNSNGTIHFAPGQTFPSTANGITSVAHDNSLTGAGTTASPLGLNGITTNASFSGAGTSASPLAFSSNVAMPGTLTTSGAITASTSASDAVYGNSSNAYGTGVTGVSYGTYGYGVVAEGTVDGLYAYGGTYAGQFYGNVTVNGTLSKSGGSFKIDDPIDPANKYLSHSFVESPDMMNIYNGNVTTDAKGEAVVTMPDYFEALNRDFRYQLTVMGQFAQAIVGSKISGNTFVIKTDKPGVEVSWQVTGVRQDVWANAHRIPNEEAKPTGERGHYLHPELFGHTGERSISEFGRMSRVQTPVQ